MIEMGPKAPVRVVLADDHGRHRQLMALVLGLDRRVRIVGLASNGDQAVTLVRDLDPDVVLLDARMPGLGGVDACARIRRESPSTACVMLTMSDDPDDIDAAFMAGAKAYVYKATAAADIVDVVLRFAPDQMVGTSRLASEGQPLAGRAVARPQANTMPAHVHS